MIDTHSHIYGEEFANDIDDVILRARRGGVERVFLPNINEESIMPMLALCRRYPDFLYPMIGLHPEDVREDWLQVLNRMEELLAASVSGKEEPSYIAVGEVGLDFYWDATYRAEQLRAFEYQMQWAIRYHLPLMIHCRSAHQEMVQLMSKYQEEELTGVFHCFGGTTDEAADLLQFRGFMLGIGGVVTYKKSGLPETLKSVPLDRIVLETDSPYLAPVPHRGKRNESVYVADVLHFLAGVYNVSWEEVETQTNANVNKVFSKNIPSISYGKG